MELVGPNGMPILAAGLSALFLILLLREVRTIRKRPRASIADGFD
jgi:hypothetical protein